MWKCKTCDKVNTDTFEVCWGCYTPKRNNYIELGDTDVTASFDDLQEKDSKHSPGIKIIKPFIAFLIANIPIVIMIIFMIIIAIAANGNGKGGNDNFTPIIAILVIFGLFWFLCFWTILLREKIGKYLGLFLYPITELISVYYAGAGLTLNQWILILTGFIGITCGLYCIYFLLFVYPEFIEK